MSFLTTIYHDFIILLKAPILRPEMIWIVAPLLIIIVLMMLYFARYRDEELGWNTATANSLLLVFVSVDLFREIFSRTTSITGTGIHIPAIILVSLLLLEGIILLFVNFSHILPKKISYFISSPLSVNIIAYVMIVMIYSEIPISFSSIIAMIVLFTLLFLLFKSFGNLSRNGFRKLEKLKQKEVIDDVKKQKRILIESKQAVQKEKEKIKKVERKKEKEVEQKKEELKNVRKVINHTPAKKKNRSDNNKRKK